MGYLIVHALLHLGYNKNSYFSSFKKEDTKYHFRWFQKVYCTKCRKEIDQNDSVHKQL